eukprot:1723068-Pyramimonas_sp.AAC.1
MTAAPPWHAAVEPVGWPSPLRTSSVVGAFVALAALRCPTQRLPGRRLALGAPPSNRRPPTAPQTTCPCLLYTSDAADDTPCVDL